jgi:hypothetical protein
MDKLEKIPGFKLPKSLINFRIHSQKLEIIWGKFPKKGILFIPSQRRYSRHFDINTEYGR